MTSLPDIGEVADMMTEDPIADIAPLIAYDFQGLLGWGVPNSLEPFRLRDFSRR